MYVCMYVCMYCVYVLYVCMDVMVAFARQAVGFDVGRPSSLGRQIAFRMPARICACCEQGACARVWLGPAGKALYRFGEAVR